jgi:hypothetical protein
MVIQDLQVLPWIDYNKYLLVLTWLMRWFGFKQIIMPDDCDTRSSRSLLAINESTYHKVLGEIIIVNGARHNTVDNRPDVMHVRARRVSLK